MLLLLREWMWNFKFKFEFCPKKKKKGLRIYELVFNFVFLFYGFMIFGFQFCVLNSVFVFLFKIHLNLNSCDFWFLILFFLVKIDKLIFLIQMLMWHFFLLPNQKFYYYFNGHVNIQCANSTLHLPHKQFLLVR